MTPSSTPIAGAFGSLTHTGSDAAQEKRQMGNEELEIGNEKRSEKGSLRGHFARTFVGNVTYAACQWGMLMALARLGDAETVGRFALALAVTGPIFLFANLNTRGLLASDARGEHPFADYFGLRVVTTALALVASLVVVRIGGYDSAALAACVGVALAKSAEALSDIAYGLFQKHGETGIVARSLALRGILGLGAVTAGMAWGGGLTASVVGLALVTAFSALALDLPTARRLLAREPRATSRGLGVLAWTALPLGVVMALASLAGSVPRFFVERSAGLAELGVFLALAYLLIAGTTVTNALGQAAVPRLSQLAVSDRAGFVRLTAKLAGLGAGLGLAGLAVAWVAGGPILALLYGPDYGERGTLLVALFGAATLTFPGSLLGYALTAARILRPQASLHAIVLVVTLATSAFAIPTWGLYGAAATLALAGCVQTIGSCVLLATGSFEERAAEVCR